MDNERSLDFAFLNYLGVSQEGEQKVHRFYLPFLSSYKRVVDLGCGLGGFVKLLRDQGVDAFGVDSDGQAVAEAVKQGLPVLKDNLLQYLRQAREESLDAIFSAHVIEHLPYQAVLEMIELSFRVLRPKGRLLLVTPNPRALVSHLELYPLHFSHVSMYHPDLLAFFMTYSGFGGIKVGENPDTKTPSVTAASPLLGFQNLLDLKPILRQGSFSLDNQLPPQSNPLSHLLRAIRRKLFSWLVQPVLSDMENQMTKMITQINQISHEMVQVAQTLDRPFECYALGDKI
jgi:SAM-dependent methyltransferase